MIRISDQIISQPLGENCDMSIYDSSTTNLKEFILIGKIKNDFPRNNIKNKNKNKNKNKPENQKLNSDNKCSIKIKYLNYKINSDKKTSKDCDDCDKESIKEFKNKEECSIKDRINLYLNKTKNYQISAQKLRSQKDSTLSISPLQNSFPLKISNQNSRSNSIPNVFLFSSFSKNKNKNQNQNQNKNLPLASNKIINIQLKEFEDDENENENENLDFQNDSKIADYSIQEKKFHNFMKRMQNDLEKRFEIKKIQENLKNQKHEQSLKEYFKPKLLTSNYNYLNINYYEKKSSQANEIRKFPQPKFKNNSQNQVKGECNPNNFKDKCIKSIKNIENKNISVINYIFDVKNLKTPKETKEDLILLTNNNIPQRIKTKIIEKEIIKGKIERNKRYKRNIFLREENLNKTEEALNFLQIIESENA